MYTHIYNTIMYIYIYIYMYGAQLLSSARACFTRIPVTLRLVSCQKFILEELAQPL